MPVFCAVEFLHALQDEIARRHGVFLGQIHGYNLVPFSVRGAEALDVFRHGGCDLVSDRPVAIATVAVLLEETDADELGRLCWKLHDSDLFPRLPLKPQALDVCYLDGRHLARRWLTKFASFTRLPEDIFAQGL